MTEKNIWEKNLFLLCFSQFFYRAGSRSLLPFLPLYAKNLGNLNTSDSAVWTGWILAAPFIISFFTTPFWGSVGDKYGRKFTAMLSIIGFVIAQYLMSGAVSLLYLFLASSLQEFFGGAYPAAVSLTAANSPKEKTADALSYLQFSNALGNIAGPIFGGFLADAFGFRFVFIAVGTIVLLFSTPVLFFINEDCIQKEAHYHSIFKNSKYFFNKKGLIACSILLLAYTLSITIMRPGFTLFVQSNFEAIKNPASTAGILLGILGAASSVSTLFLPWLNKKLSIVKNIFITFLFAGLLFIILPMNQNILLFGFIIFLTGFATGIILPLIFSLMSYETDNERKAGVMGVGSSFQMVGNLVGPISAGYIISAFGVKFPFIFSGAVLLIAIVIYLKLGKQSDLSQ